MLSSSKSSSNSEQSPGLSIVLEALGRDCPPRRRRAPQRRQGKKRERKKPDFDLFSLSPFTTSFFSLSLSRAFLPLSRLSPQSSCSPPPHALLARRGEQLAVSILLLLLPSTLLSHLECRSSNFVVVVVIASSHLSFQTHLSPFFHLHPTQFPPREQVIALVAASTAAVSLLVAAPQLVGPREEIASRSSSATASSSSHQSPPSPGFRKTSARSAIRSNAAPGPGGRKEE